MSTYKITIAEVVMSDDAPRYQREREVYSQVVEDLDVAAVTALVNRPRRVRKPKIAIRPLVQLSDEDLK